MEILGMSKVKQAVYIQMRQATRGEDGKLQVVRTKTRTIRNATIEEVWAMIERGAGGKRK